MLVFDMAFLLPTKPIYIYKKVEILNNLFLQDMKEDTAQKTNGWNLKMIFGNHHLQVPR